MRTSDWMKMAAVAAALSLGGLTSCAQQSSSQQGSSQQTGDALADAARKARAEKKSEQKPKKVFTDDDVKPAAPEATGKPAASGAASGAEAAGDQKAGDAAEKEDPNSEKAWRKRFAEIHLKIARAEKELDVLQRELEKSQVQYYPDPQKALTEQNNRADINEKNAKITAKKKELDDLRQELDDLETQLRKAGGDPGWAQ
jgi:chromosome segregation ATPase